MQPEVSRETVVKKDCRNVTAIGRVCARVCVCECEERWEEGLKQQKGTRIMCDEGWFSVSWLNPVAFIPPSHLPPLLCPLRCVSLCSPALLHVCQ